MSQISVVRVACSYLSSIPKLSLCGNLHAWWNGLLPGVTIMWLFAALYLYWKSQQILNRIIESRV